MNATIEKMRYDQENWRTEQENWRIEQEKKEAIWRVEDRREARKFMFQAFATAAGCVLAGCALATLVFHLTGQLH